jgi:putative oxidoreductase
MKVLAHIQRSLLGLIFVVTGLNGFFRFLHQPSFKTVTTRELMTVMQATSYGHVVFGLQVVCGLLPLARLSVPIALIILAGYLINIYMFHIFLDHTFNPLALFGSVLWVLTFLRGQNHDWITRSTPDAADNESIQTKNEGKTGDYSRAHAGSGRQCDQAQHVAAPRSEGDARTPSSLVRSRTV